MVRRGRVTVDGVRVQNPSLRCIPEKVRIEVEGRPVVPRRRVVIMMNKPAGIVTTRSDERGRSTVYTILGELGQWLFPVGRLDKESSGLLLLTNDTVLGEKLTNPDTKVPKHYEVILDREFRDEDGKKFESGMSVGQKRFLPASVQILGARKVSVTIKEGKNRQLRRMFEAAGYRVEGLCRTAVGKLTLRGLEEGKWRYLKHEEIDRMFQTP